LPEVTEGGTDRRTEENRKQKTDHNFNLASSDGLQRESGAVLLPA
jgi:hypothetical protein